MGSFSLILIATITFLTGFTNACNGVNSGGGGNSGGTFVSSYRMFFFTGPPPEKFKYGKLRLGEVRCI